MSSKVLSPDRLRKHLNALCLDIGTRVAGSAEEHQGARYIAEQFRALGLETEVQEFPCITYGWTDASLQARLKGRWQAVDVQPNSHSPATDGEIEAELVFLETGAPEHLADHDLRGKIGLLFGSAYASLERMQRLCNSGLAALLYVDDRFPTTWNVASGMIAGWFDALTIPTATIPYMAAWDLVRQGADSMKLRLDMFNCLSTSANVVATIPGRKNLPGVLAGGHYDSVALGVGAEDDASGVAVTIELARALAKTNPLRPIKLTAFGWEENLSEGARQFVINPRNGVEGAAIMFNLDSIGAWLGRDEVLYTGSPSLRRFLTRSLREQRFAANVRAEVSPYSDQFPHNLLGVPSVWFFRLNSPDSRWYHHSQYDQIEVLNFDHLARTGDATLALMTEVAQAAELPFDREIPAAQQRQIEQFRRDIYDPICDWRTPDLMRPAEGPRRELDQ